MGLRQTGLGFGLTRKNGASSGSITIPTTSLTAEYVSSAAADFSLTGAAVNTWREHNGNTDLDLAFSSGTKANRNTTHPINTTGETVDTNNAFGDYFSAVGGTLSDIFPSGTGSLYLVVYVDSHPDSFNDNDWIFKSSADANFKVSIKDGPNFTVGTNADAQQVSQSITLDAWHLISVRFGTGAGGLKVQIDDNTEQSGTGAAISTLTGRLQAFADSGGAGRFDGALAHVLFYSATHDDSQRDVVKSALRALYADI